MHRKLSTYQCQTFFIKDRVEKGEIKIEYCPTELMLANFLTKPLQGKALVFFWNIIMGYTPISEILNTIRDNNIFAIKERVGKHGNHKKSEDAKKEKDTVIPNISNTGLTHLTRLGPLPTITYESKQTPQKIQRSTWKDVLLQGVLQDETTHET